MAKDPKAGLTFDKRVVERNIKKGLLTREEYEKHLASLPDVGEQAEKIRAKLGEEEEPEVAEADEGDDEEVGEDEPGDEG